VGYYHERNLNLCATEFISGLGIFVLRVLVDMTDPTKKGFLLYLEIVVGLTALFCLLVFAINRMVDPLWHFGGNILFDENYAFNERHSKSNLYLKNALRYDCIILGNSRVTLLNQTHIPGYKCFNFAFSAATPGELVEYVKYIKKMGKTPKYAIIGVDGRNFWRNERASRSPDFILQLRAPPNLFHDYLNISAFGFSLRTLVRNPPFPRYYRNDFSPGILATPSYVPSTCVTPSTTDREFTLNAMRHYQQIRELWPDAKLIGYVPPISAWEFGPLYYDKTLSGYIDAIYEASTLFDDFFDFSVPSPITRNAKRSFDGDHYNLDVNRLIADTISGGRRHFGLDVKTLTRTEYRRAFISAVEHFIISENIHLSTKPGCLSQSEARD
jgi:hypothetical protein